MNPHDLYRGLLATNNVASVERALQQFEGAQGEAAQWTPLGGRENNQGTVGASSDSGRSLVERLTNGIDAVMEDEYERHQGRPACRSPREAAAAWLNIPDCGLSEMGPAQRRALDTALAVFRHALKLKPDDLETQWNIGVVQVGMGQTKEALAAYDHILSLKPDFIETHFSAAVKLSLKNWHDKAVASLSKSADQNPNDVAPK